VVVVVVLTLAARVGCAHPTAVLQERQLLLDLKQNVVFLDKAGVNARSMVVVLPRVLPDGARVVWCPRCPRDSCSPRAGRRLSVCAPVLTAPGTAPRSLTSALAAEGPAGAGAGASSAGDAARRGCAARDVDTRENTNPVAASGPSDGCCCAWPCPARIIFVCVCRVPRALLFRALPSPPPP
jgi:hypothetical protein